MKKIWLGIVKWMDRVTRGEVTVTTRRHKNLNKDECVAVTRQNSEGRILSTIWTKK